MLENVKQRTIEPLIKATAITGTMVYTDEYARHYSLEQGLMKTIAEYKKV